MNPTLEQKNIDLQIVLKDTGLVLDVDNNLIEQVLLNLVVNSIEAVKDIDDAKIILSAYYDPPTKRSLKLQIMARVCRKKCWIKYLFLFYYQEKRKRDRVKFMQTDYDAA